MRGFAARANGTNFDLGSGTNLRMGIGEFPKQQPAFGRLSLESKKKIKET